MHAAYSGNSLSVLAREYVHTHTHTHTQSHACTHTHTHTHTHTMLHTDTHKLHNTHMYTHTHTTHMYTHTHTTHMYTHTHTQTHAASASVSVTSEPSRAKQEQGPVAGCRVWTGISVALQVNYSWWVWARSMLNGTVSLPPWTLWQLFPQWPVSRCWMAIII